MLTIFTNPRPFTGPFDTIQRNAITSWRLLHPECEIFLFNDEENTTVKAAADLGVNCIEDLTFSEFGTPLIDSEFSLIRKIAKYNVLAHVNSDIILMGDFIEAIAELQVTLEDTPFFMIGRRWDLDVQSPIDFGGNWTGKLDSELQRSGRLHGLAGIDYWVFPKSFNFDPPPFIAGRPGIDSWLVYKARSAKIPVIDATAKIRIIHQNHSYPSRKRDYYEIETSRNLNLAGGYTCLMTLRDADWVYSSSGLARKNFPDSLLSSLSLFYPWRLLLAIKRSLQNLLAGGK